MSTRKAHDKAVKILEFYRQKGLKLAIAESCTGGMISAALTDVPGSSAVFECGFVTYSNRSKTELLGVSAKLIGQHGAVSAEVAENMARGALYHSDADIAIAVTGIAGPGGGTKAKPVGLVYIAASSRHSEDVIVTEHYFKGSRAAIRAKTVEKSLSLLKKLQPFF